jgi:hypothetical protein
MIRADSQENFCGGYDWSMDYSRVSDGSLDSGVHDTSCSMLPGQLLQYVPYIALAGGHLLLASGTAIQWVVWRKYQATPSVK